MLETFEMNAKSACPKAPRAFRTESSKALNDEQKSALVRVMSEKAHEWIRLSSGLGADGHEISLGNERLYKFTGRRCRVGLMHPHR